MTPRRSRSFAWLAAVALGAGLIACNLPFTQPPATIAVPTVPPAEGASPIPALASPATTPGPTAAPAAGGQLVLYQPYAIVLAYVGPQTGTGSGLFTPLQQASQQALDDHGLVHGFGVNLVPFNDQCDNATGASVAQQVVADDHLVAVLGPVCSAAAEGALPILEAAGVVMISGSVTEPGLWTFGPTVFHRTLLNDDQIAAEGYVSQIYIEDLPSVQAFFSGYGGALLPEGRNHYIPYQYDAAGILLRALDLSAVLQPDGSLLIDRAALRAAVRGTAAYSGVTGSITFDTQGNRLP